MPDGCWLQIGHKNNIHLLVYALFNPLMEPNLVDIQPQ